MDLFKVIAAIESDSQARAFLDDLCTPKEIDTLIERWEVAKLLSTKQYSYREIASETGVSTTTIGRVARFIKYGNNGYKMILERTK